MTGDRPGGHCVPPGPGGGWGPVTTLSTEVEKSRGYIARAEGAAQNRVGSSPETFKLEAL